MAATVRTIPEILTYTYKAGLDSRLLASHTPNSIRFVVPLVNKLRDLRGCTMTMYLEGRNRYCPKASLILQIYSNAWIINAP